MVVRSLIFVLMGMQLQQVDPKASPSPKSSGFLGFAPQPGIETPLTPKQLGLSPLRDGGYFYKGSIQERFDARIYADGSVEFFEPGAFQFKVDVLCFGIVCPIVKPKPTSAPKPLTKRDITRAKIKRIARQAALGILAGVASSAGQDDSVSLFPGNYEAGLGTQRRRPAVRPVYGAFYMAGRFGYLPPLSAPKRLFLQKTHDFRLDLAVQAKEQAMRAAITRLHASLKSIETDTQHSPAQRRAALLRLWCEFDLQDEQGQLRDHFAKGLSESLRTKISFARRQILGFARRVFPQGSPAQFLSSELSTVNEKRQGADRFLPYQKPAAPKERVDGSSPAQSPPT